VPIFQGTKKAREKPPGNGHQSLSRVQGSRTNAGLRRNGLKAGIWLEFGCQFGQIDAGLDWECWQFRFLFDRLTLLGMLFLWIFGV
jgi:hypothetical protein